MVNELLGTSGERQQASSEAALSSWEEGKPQVASASARYNKNVCTDKLPPGKELCSGALTPSECQWTKYIEGIMIVMVTGCND